MIKNAATPKTTNIPMIIHGEHFLVPVVHLSVEQQLI
jgi:hypothetical protein